ncbi:MAG TPA: DUF3147 family protein [Candidatus Poseidoniales archaeon]|nr:DUF3147 family protein [Candidatus Poseidoniales archaeon]
MQLAVRALVSGGLIVAASEVAKKNELLGALIISVPLISIMAIIWLYNDTSDVEQVADFTTGILYLVIPSLTLFLSFPVLLRRGMEFWPALGLACLFTIGAYYVGLQLVERYANIA